MWYTAWYAVTYHKLLTFLMVACFLSSPKFERGKPSHPLCRSQQCPPASLAWSGLIIGNKQKESSTWTYISIPLEWPHANRRRAFSTFILRFWILRTVFAVVFAQKILQDWVCFNYISLAIFSTLCLYRYPSCSAAPLQLGTPIFHRLRSHSHCVGRGKGERTNVAMTGFWLQLRNCSDNLKQTVPRMSQMAARISIQMDQMQNWMRLWCAGGWLQPWDSLIVNVVNFVNVFPWVILSIECLVSHVSLILAKELIDRCLNTSGPIAH